jgi:hypothetical protein
MPCDLSSSRLGSGSLLRVTMLRYRTHGVNRFVQHAPDLLVFRRVREILLPVIQTLDCRVSTTLVPGARENPDLKLPVC